MKLFHKLGENPKRQPVLKSAPTVINHSHAHNKMQEIL